MSSIESANVAVEKVMLTTSCVTEDDEMDDCKHRGTYQQFTSKEKLELGKRAAKFEITSMIHYFIARPGEERTLFAWKEKMEGLKLLAMYASPNIFINMMSTYN